MVTPQLLPRPTPCPAWDLAMLLGHITDSAEVLHDPISAGRIGIRGALRGSGPVPRLRGQLATWLASTAAAGRSQSGTVSSRRACLRSPVP